MSYIITDDKHYQAIGEALQRKRGEDDTYLPSEMAAAINTIPSAVDGTDLPCMAIYWTKPDGTGRPTECDIVNWHTDTPLSWSNILAQNGFTKIQTIKFINCDNISSINAQAFNGCSSLASITLPNSVTSINAQAFSGCSSLASINIPNNVTSIGLQAFYGCTSLTIITIPNSVTNIGDWVFRECTSLTSVTIPNSVTSIGQNAFQNCTSLGNVTLGQDFNCSLNLSYSTKYSADTMVAMFEALKDLTGQTAKTLTLGATNLAKLTAEQKQIATSKNWNLA